MAGLAGRPGRGRTLREGAKPSRSPFEAIERTVQAIALHLFNKLDSFMILRPLQALIRAATSPTFYPSGSIPTFHQHSSTFARTYASLPTPKTPRKPFPTMAAVTDQDIIARLGKLSIAAPEVLKHAAVKGGAEWRAELDKAGKTGINLTKTVSGPPSLRSLLGAAQTHTHTH